MYKIFALRSFANFPFIHLMKVADDQVSTPPRKGTPSEEGIGSSPAAGIFPKVDLPRSRIVDGVKNKKTDEGFARDVLRGGGVLVKGERFEFWFDPSLAWDKQGLEESQPLLQFSSESAPPPASSKDKKSSVGGSNARNVESGTKRWIRGTVVSSNKSRWTVTLDLDSPLAVATGGKKPGVKTVVVHVKTARWKLLEFSESQFSGRIYQARSDQKPSLIPETAANEPLKCEVIFADSDCKEIDLVETKKEFLKARRADSLIKKTYSFKYSVPPHEQAEMDQLRKTEREGVGNLNREVKAKTDEINQRMDLQIMELEARRSTEAGPIEALYEARKKSIDLERDEKTAQLESLEGRASGTGSSLRVQKKQIDDHHKARWAREVVPFEKKLSEIDQNIEKAKKIVQQGARDEINSIERKRNDYIAALKARQQALRDKWKKLSEDDVNSMRLSQNIRLEKEWVLVRKNLAKESRLGKNSPNLLKGLDLQCIQCKLEPGFSFQQNKCDSCFKFSIYEDKITELNLRVPWANNRSSSEFLPYHVFYQERSRQIRAERPNTEPALISQQLKEEWKKLPEMEKNEFERKRQNLLLELLDHIEEEEEEDEEKGTTESPDETMLPETPAIQSGLKRGLASKESIKSVLETSSDDYSEDSDEACMRCLSFKKPGLILQCDRTEGEALSADDDRICGGMLHTYCCDPRLESVPEGAWYCSSMCKWVEDHKPAIALKKVVSKKDKQRIVPEVLVIDDEEDQMVNEQREHSSSRSSVAVKLDVAIAKKKRMEFILSQWNLIEYFLGDQAVKVKSSIRTKLEKIEVEISNSFTGSIDLGPKIIRTPFPFDRTPAYVNANMRPYQLEGLSWFVEQHDKGANSIMGDEMGLGKTLQTLSFIATLHEYIPFFSPTLVVAPLSVLPNWLAEAKKWTPQLNVVGLFGPLAERERIKASLHANSEVNVIVTTYEILLAEINWLRSQYFFRYFILDEAQKIKNTDALVTQACRQIRSVYRVLLTGTPLQNNMKELWALLNFLYPEVFTANTAIRFASAYDSSTGSTDDTSTSMIKDDGLMKQCFKLLEPIMLRRLKQNVLAAHLPPKTEIVLQAPMSLAQQHHYRQVLRTVTGLVRNVGYKNVSSLLWQLWKCCLHPFLFEGVEEAAAEGAQGHSVDSKIVWMSGKMCLLDALLLKLFDLQSKCLVYSQYTSMLDIIEEYCQWRGWKYLRLDGSTSLARRRFYMHLFNKPVTSQTDFSENHYFVFLVSTKAGGVGVNLQAANSVILYDSSWNPFVDAQAEDRAHRMGQKKEVTIYRLITKGSCEERIRFFAQQKLKMKQFVLNEDENGEKSVLEADLADEAADVSKIYSKDQLKDIIEFGSEDLLSLESGDSAAQFNPVIGEKFYESCCSALDHQIEQAKKLKLVMKENIPSSSRAVQLSPVKKNICIRKFQDEDFTQTKIERTTEMDWLDKMEEEKVLQRNRKSTTVTVDTKEKGLGKIQISKWSIEQEEREREMMERDRARIEAKKIGGNKRVTEHDMTCLHCRESVLKQRVIVTSEVDENGNTVKKRRIDSDNSGFQACPICPATMHVGCLRLAVHGADVTTRSSCPQHKCKLCRRSASNAGGLLFRCVDCPNALCFDCIEKYEMVDKFNFLERDKVKWESDLHFVAASTYEYMRCPECVSAL